MFDPRQPAAILVIIWTCLCCFVGCGTRFQSEQLNAYCIADSEDRERVLTEFGAPDKIEAHPNAPTRPAEEGEGDGFPFELWHYAHMDGIGDDVDLEFVDADLCGNYKLANREIPIGSSSPNE